MTMHNVELGRGESRKRTKTLRYNVFVCTLLFLVPTLMVENAMLVKNVFVCNWVRAPARAGLEAGPVWIQHACGRTGPANSRTNAPWAKASVNLAPRRGAN